MLNTLYSSVSVTMFSQTVHSGLAGHEKGYKFGGFSDLFKSYDTLQALI